MGSMKTLIDAFEGHVDNTIVNADNNPKFNVYNKIHRLLLNLRIQNNNCGDRTNWCYFEKSDIKNIALRITATIIGLENITDDDDQDRMAEIMVKAYSIFIEKFDIMSYEQFLSLIELQENNS